LIPSGGHIISSPPPLAASAGRLDLRQRVEYRFDFADNLGAFLGRTSADVPEFAVDNVMFVVHLSKVQSLLDVPVGKQGEQVIARSAGPC
jgi:hypothetical protein